MKWIKSKPKKGDAVRIKVFSIYHFGIYINDEEIIQFGLPHYDFSNNFDQNKIEVCVSNIFEFSHGNQIEVGIPTLNEKKCIKSPEKIIEYAKSKIGEKNYNFLTNNCYHFVMKCLFGNDMPSNTLKNVLAKVKNNIYVFLSKIPKNLSLKQLENFERQKEIDACTNHETKLQKMYIWNCLEFALKNSFNLNLNELNPHKNTNGKLICKNCNVSLSHSKDYVVVAISKQPIGVDIENISRMDNKILNHIINPAETVSAQPSKKEIAILWTKKEAVFKLLDEKIFIPKNLNVNEFFTESYIVNDDLVLSIASKTDYVVNGLLINTLEPNNCEKIHF